MANNNATTKEMDPNTKEQDEVASDGKKARIQFLTGMKEDLAARMPLYWDDWKCPRSPIHVLNATWFVFVVQLIPALIFAELLDKQTEGRLAVAEVVSATLECKIFSILLVSNQLFLN